MFSKPEIGKTVTVSTDWNDVFKVYADYVRATHGKNTTSGKVVASADHDDPNSFRLLTNNANYPVSVIPLERVIELEFDDGSKADVRQEIDLPDEETWQASGSKGSSYIVTRRGNTWTCECKGFQFRQACKHINEKKQEVLDR